MIVSRNWIREKLAEIYRTAEEIEAESSNYSDTFLDAQYIQSEVNELDTELTKFFDYLYDILIEAKETGYIDDQTIESLLYALGR